MSQWLGFETWGPTEHRSFARAASVAALALVFLPLGYLGVRGQREARRQAQINDIVYCRELLQEAMDSRRSAAGPTQKRPAGDPQSLTRPVMEWAARLGKRAAEFRSAHPRAAGAEELELRLSEAMFAVVERRFPAALGAIDALERSAAVDPVHRNRRADLLRLRADTSYDMADWMAALDSYQKLLELDPQLLSAAEGVAACLHSLGQVDAARQTYAELAARLHERGSRLLVRLDHSGAARDLNQAATLRLWLVEQGRHDLTSDLARSFHSCSSALAELENLGLADAYAAHAIDIQSQLVERKYRAELAAELAASHALRARILFDRNDAQHALTHLSAAIGVESRLIGEGKTELQSELAANLAQRGLALQSQGQLDPAARDFASAAEAFASAGDLMQAVAWQTRAFDLAAPGANDEARSRLEEYKKRKLELPPAHSERR